MNDKNNELDLILSQYSSKKEKEKKASIDELDSLIGSFSAANKASEKSALSDVTLAFDENFDDDAVKDAASENGCSAEQESVLSEDVEDNFVSDDELAENDEILMGVDDVEVSDIDSDEFSENNNSDIKSKYKKSKKKAKKAKKSKVNSSIFVALIVVCVVLTTSFAIAIFGINMGMEYLGVGKKDVTITMNIPKGSSSDDIIELLYKNGIIDNKTLFKITLKIKNAGGNLKPGDITLQPSMGYDAIIARLCNVRESFEQVSITFPEGISLYQAAQLLEENEVCSAEDFLYQFNSEDFGFDYEKEISTSAEKFYKCEGLFFPNTYSFYIDDSAYNVTKNMREQFEKMLVDNDIYEKVKKSGMSMEDVIILASIVQAEAATEEDMKYVASVFINRLNNPSEFPKLQSDATDNYYTNVIVPQNGDTTSLAMFKDAYDTYIKKGLPAGAVGNPGLDAILAVVDAPKTNYFYFCSNLATKECFYAETLAEHEENLVKAGLV